MIVIVCFVCYKFICIVVNEDENVMWDCYVWINCDLSNYEKVIKKFR